VRIHGLRPEEKRTREALGAQVRSELAFAYRSTREASGFIRSYTKPREDAEGPEAL
jgi:hypothetical protein